jgi:hypothetical protein
VSRHRLPGDNDERSVRFLQLELVGNRIEGLGVKPVGTHFPFATTDERAAAAELTTRSMNVFSELRSPSNRAA